MYNLIYGGLAKDIQVQMPDTDTQCQVILHGQYNDTTNPRNAITLVYNDPDDLEIEVYKGIYQDRRYLLAR